MLVQTSAKFRIYPTESQEKQLAIEFGHNRFVYNHYLSKHSQQTTKDGKKKLTWNGNKWTGYIDASKDLTNLKQDVEWLKDASRTTFTATLRHLHDAFCRFFKKQTEYPTYKSKYDDQNVTYQDSEIINNKTIKIPKCGLIKAKITQEIGEVKQVTVSKTTTGKYFASVSFNQEVEVLPVIDTAVGLDVGLKSFITTNDGEIIKTPKWYQDKQKKLRRYQRQQAKRTKGGSNRNRSRQIVARIHEKIVNTKRDFYHKLSKQLIDENQVIAVENLNVQGMMQNRKLSKSIWQSGWYMFKQMLKYKSDWYGRTFVEVDPKHTTQDCSECGYRNRGLTLNDRNWTCPVCHTHHDRDVNAAKNILYRGIGYLSGGTGDVKRFPGLSTKISTWVDKVRANGAVETIVCRA